MPMPDALGAVARDLALLNADDRRAILRALDPADRDRLDTALRGTPTTAPASGERRHSPWVDELITAARNDDDRMTPATRTALLDAVGQARVGAARPAGRSLLQAAGGLLGQAMAR